MKKDDSNEIVILKKELAFQNEEKQSRAAELLIANVELAFQNDEKENRAAELLTANVELAFQNDEKEKRAAELLTANIELAFQNEEKENRAAELLIANIELAFQNDEKEKRAAELLIANKELAFQNVEKENRAAELVIANKELAFQNVEKENRAAELVIANVELAFQNTEKEKRMADFVSLTEKLRLQQEEKFNDLYQVEEKLTMAINAANMGTYSIDSNTLIISASARFQELFGLKLNEPVFFKWYISQIRADYRQEVFDKMKAALKHGEHFDMEFPIIRFDNKQVRWLKVVGDLQNNINVTNKVFTGAAMDITEQKHDEQRKDDFINIVSHELKTPLTSLSGYIQILRGKARKAEDQFAIVILDKTVIQTKKMTTMINGFLNVSRLESGKIHIDKQRFNMANLLKEIKVETHNMISSHPILFEPTEDIYVHADRDKIDQVIHNLISNAVKYSPAKSHINVSCSIITDTVCVSVKDTGMGVGLEDVKNLFDRYYRVEGKQMHNISGFGIGLYLCAEIIHRHDGKIWVESEVSKGSTFHFSLPLPVNLPE